MYCMHRWIILFCCLVLVGSTSTNAVQPIRIGMSISLSGDYAPMGDMYAKGLRLWAGEINKKGGILGRPVAVLIYDDFSSPQKAREIYERILSKEHIDLVIGPYSSVIARAIQPIVEKHRCPTLLPLAASASIWNGNSRYVFGMHTPGRRWTSAVLAFLARHGIEKIGFLVNKKLLGLGPNALDEWAERLGQEILFQEALIAGDVENQLEAKRKTGAQAVLVWGYMDDTVAVRRGLAKIGWQPRVFFAHIAPALEEYHRILGPLADYTLGTSVWEPSIADRFPGGKHFLEEFLHKYEITPSYHAPMGFAAGQVLARAVAEAGTTDWEKLRRELSLLDMITVVGRYRVDPNGRQLRQLPLIIQWQAGKKKVLWPKDVSNGELMFPPREQP